MIAADTPLTEAGMLTPAQLRAARALLGWSRDELADRSGIAAVTTKGFELGDTDPKLSTLLKWRRALEAGGVIFIEPDDVAGPGVRMRREAESKGKRGKS